MALLALLLAWLAMHGGTNGTPHHAPACSGYYDNVAHTYIYGLCEDDPIADQVRRWANIGWVAVRAS